MLALIVIAALFWAALVAWYAGFRPPLCWAWLAALLLGVLSAFVALELSAFQDRGVDLGGDRTLRERLYFYTAHVGFREETLKLLVILPLLWWRRQNGLVEALVLGGLSGLGFAAFENEIFGRLNPSLVLGRLFAANVFHLFASALAAVALHRFLVQPSVRQGLRSTGVFLLIVLAHGCHNTFIGSGPLIGNRILSLAVLLSLGLAFFHLAEKYGRLSHGRAMIPVSVFLLFASFNGGAIFLMVISTLPPSEAWPVGILAGLELLIFALIFLHRFRRSGTSPQPVPSDPTAG